MRCRPFQSMSLAAVLVSGAAGCASTAPRVGLHNVPAREWRQARQADQGETHDVISNGDDSCQRPHSDRRDPMPIRLYPCPGQLPEGTRVAKPK